MLGKKVHQLLLIMALFGLFAKSLQGCPKMYAGIKSHTACVARSSKAIESGVSESDKELILKVHNRYREKVDPPACDMIKLYWDDDLAYVAQKWADHCEFNHDKGLQRRIPGKFSVGQNLAQGHQNWEAAMNGWHDEVKQFKFGVGSQNLMAIGHYTQMVWASTTRVGCGYTRCTNLRSYYVCNYGPAGNLMGKLGKPYTKCKDGEFTDCKSSVCYNGGVLNRHTCKCTCPKRKNIWGDKCSLNCSLAKDGTDMCSGSSEKDCADFSNIPDECPWKCGICPYAGYRDLRKQNQKETPTENEDVDESASDPESSDVDESASDPESSDAEDTETSTEPSSSVSPKNGSIVICVTLFLYVHAVTTGHI